MCPHGVCVAGVVWVFLLSAVWNQHNLQWYFNLLLWKGQQLVFNGYRMVTCNPIPAAVTTVPRADSQHLVSGTHQCSRLLPPSLPVDRPPPAAGTALSLQGTNVLLLLGDRTGQTLDFKGIRERRPQADCPYSFIHLLPWLAEISLIRAIREGAFWSDCGLHRSVSFSLLVSLKAIVAIYLFRPPHLLSLCSMPGNLLSARNIDLNTLIPDLEKVTV